MKEHPILFNGEMVRAVLDGTKTQTRRVVRYAEDIGWFGWPCDGDPHPAHPRRNCQTVPRADEAHYHRDNGFHHGTMRCPYGSPGDRLHVGETLIRVDDGNGYPCAVYERTNETVFEEDGLPVKWRWKVKKLTSMYCPKAYRRIWLEVTGVRVERVQEIDDKGALAEGVDRTNTSIHGYATERFRRLWDSINAKRGFGWDANPWVWVVEFGRVDP